MNNKEKQEYISCLSLLGSNCSLNEIERRNEVLSKAPKVLFKYRPFDKNTFKMINEGYAYLSPVRNLDDPFDCLSDFELTSFYNEKKDRIKKDFIKYIITSAYPKIKKELFDSLLNDAIECLGEHGLDYDKTFQKLLNEGMDFENASKFAAFVVNCQSIFETYDEVGAIEAFAKIAISPYDVVGICSLSEIRDNKVMWSLYGKQYEGYCIEYEIPYTVEARKNLYPVLYSRRINNSFLTHLYDTLFAETKRNMTMDLPFINSKIEHVGSAYELFCIKDTDWRYQQEWRIIGDAEDHFTNIKIKAIYLGFKVKKTNEDKMKRCARKYGFALYKMNQPNGKKKIGYIKVI